MLLAEAKLSDGKLEYQFRKPFDALVKLLRSQEPQVPASVPESSNSGVGSKEKNWGERRELNPQPQDPQLP